MNLSDEALGLPPGFLLVVVLGFGAILGSFLNVVIYRLPRIEGYWAEPDPVVNLPVINDHPIEVGDHTVAVPLPVRREFSLAWPASHCPRCQKPIAWYDNIPVLSWLLLGGRCRRCKAPIPVRYPLVETAVALLFGGLYVRYGLSPLALGMMALTAAMVAVFWIDVDFMMIPDAITLPFIWAGLVFHTFVPPTLTGVGSSGAVLGAAAGYLLFRGIEAAARLFLKKEGMGRGDAKLAAMMGAWMGPVALAVALFMGFIAGSVAGIVVEIGRRHFDIRAAFRAVMTHETKPFPFGPSLVVGGLASMFAGDRLLSWYLGMVRG